MSDTEIPLEQYQINERQLSRLEGSRLVEDWWDKDVTQLAEQTKIIQTQGSPISTDLTIPTVSKSATSGIIVTMQRGLLLTMFESSPLVQITGVLPRADSMASQMYRVSLGYLTRNQRKRRLLLSILWRIQHYHSVNAMPQFHSAPQLMYYKDECETSGANWPIKARSACLLCWNPLITCPDIARRG